MIGAPDSELVTGTRRSAAAHGVPHEVMSAEEVHRSFPGFELPDGFLGVHEPGSSLLQPESVVSAQLDMARRAGAELRVDCKVVSWQCNESAVEVALSNGSATAAQLVLSAGAWNAQLAPGLSQVLHVERQLQQWWRPARSPERFAAAAMPVSMWQLPDARIFYTMPDTGRGLKLGWHHNGATVDPDTVDRHPSPGENAELADLLRRFLPAAKGERLANAVCFYTNTPDGHFLIDRHPADERVWIMSPCSGHGFKFASALGDVMAGLLAGEESPFDLTPFRLGRFQA
jgi:sarcosine oxidase